MDAKKIIMNFTVPPSLDDFESLATNVLDTIPEELAEATKDLVLQIEEFPDEVTEADMELEDQYELLALFKSGKEIAPGIEKKAANDDDTLIVYRRPILDMWCESGDDLNDVIRHVMIEEIARQHEFTDDEIDDMAERHYQGML